jgi:hypothetical protein
VYKIKPSFDGKPDKLKAWLVAKGYEQRPIINFNKTFMLICHNPSLGFTTKVRGCKVAGQEGSLGVMPHAPKNARECEGINLHTPKGTRILRVGVLVDPWMFKERLQGSKPNGLRNSLYHWKNIEM